MENENGRFHLQENHFPCCGGTGFSSSLANNTVSRCQLKSRLEKTQAVLDQFHRTYGPPEQASIPFHPASSAKILRHVSDTLKGYRPQGKVLKTTLEHKFELWKMALACTWRFGIDVHIVTTNQQSNFVPIPDEDKCKGPLAVFIERVDKPWDPRQIETVETLVQFAYNANTYLWVEFVVDQSKPTQGELDLKGKINRRIFEAKKKSHAEYLTKDCKSRLETLCYIPITVSKGLDNVLV
ncbi:MAG: hypothetical protein HRU19_17360 [Pseudobacteriovorax sp.]|nr:hypothetical protein [Pseudobacteriovorax sp.]